VRVEIVVYRRMRQDPDNAYASVKPLLDELVRAGWLEDDSADFLSLKVSECVEARKAAERTVVRWMPEVRREPRRREPGGHRVNGGKGLRRQILERS
jgi:hypothetical protein